jgi:hypothetical protein
MLPGTQGKWGQHGGGNEGGPSPPIVEQDKQLAASRVGDISLMEREEDGKKGQT